MGYAKHLTLTGLFCLLIYSSLCAQSTKLTKLPILVDGIRHTQWVRELKRIYHKNQDSLQLATAFSEWISEKQDEGWLDLSLIRFKADSQQMIAHFNQGALYFFDYIQLEGLSMPFVQRAGLHKLSQKKHPINWDVLNHKLKMCLNQYQNEGYPFAAFTDMQMSYRQIGPDSVGVGINYTFDAGPMIRIDSVIVKGNHRENDAFIQSLTRLSPGDLFNQDLISDIPRVLNNSIYYQQVKEPTISFKRNQKASVRINLQKKETSKLDVLLGILPPADNSQQLQFTGSVDIALVSMFRQGERIRFQFDKLTSSSQQTYLNILLPYLLKTPLKVEASLDLRKQEEDFQNINWQIAGLYSLSPSLSAKFYLHNRTTQLLGDVLTDSTRTRFPQLDGSRRTLGIGFLFENMDYKWNPTRGWDALLEIGRGIRTIKENVIIKRTRPEYYLNIDPEQNTTEINLSLKWYRKLWPRHVLHLANQTWWLGMESYLRNDQRQVGGARSIRGFNEQEFFTDFYSFFTTEYRLLLERDSYIFVFADYAYLQNRESGRLLHPFGTGIGMNYGTKAGIISIIYAIGQHEQQVFQPARGKIHIGLINQF